MAFGATEPHPGPEGVTGLLWPRTRFAHFRPASRRRWVPTIFAGGDGLTAFAETVFRLVPTEQTSRPRQIRQRPYDRHLLSTIAPTRDLTLVDLSAAADPRVTALTNAPDAQYSRTVAWAAKVHAAYTAADGMVWASRQHPTGQAVVLWVDEPARRRRVHRHELTAATIPLPLAFGRGLERLLAAAEHFDVAVITSG